MSLQSIATNENAGSAYFYTKTEIDTAVSSFLGGISTLSSFSLFNNLTVSSIVTNPTNGFIGGSGVLSTNQAIANNLTANTGTISSINAIAGYPPASVNAASVSSITVSTTGAVHNVGNIAQNLQTSSINGVAPPTPSQGIFNFCRLDGLIPNVIPGGNGTPTVISTIGLAQGPGVYSVNVGLSPYYISTPNTGLEIWLNGGLANSTTGAILVPVGPKQVTAPVGFPKFFSDACCVRCPASTLQVAYYVSGNASTLVSSYGFQGSTTTATLNWVKVA